MTVDLIKHLCDALKQDSHVFVMSVDSLAEYITIQNRKDILIENQLLVIILIIYICSKHVGEQFDLKPGIVAKLYGNISDQEVSITTIKELEFSIMKTMQRLPLYSRVDDLKTFLTIYLKHFNLRVDITGLCVRILDLIYIYYRRLFCKIRNVYKQNPNALEAFQNIITNRMYLPCGILICAIEITKLKNFMNEQNILTEISEMSGIHQNHIKLLSKCVRDIISTGGQNLPANFLSENDM